ncbi:hypothetical protein [Bacillus suaedaesalsae]|uniref:DUF4309 domain-containing protein n=1 Tax=Bacillus suaedaesalsae TaxID=2810349 RepID=A0ABS2DNI3_9BACI|nr:hypothetical protein [Bacillus suaedaesalsae]MBM6619076.1 hypothetical protein [Bacillus suaedaesalsae]
MSKKIILAALSICLLIVFYLFASRPISPVKPTIPASSSIPALSLEERVCEEVSVKFGDCKKIHLFDANSKLVFAESSSGIIPVLTNEDFTEFKKIINSTLDFQEFKEEKGDRVPIDWRAKNNVQKDFSVIYGFAEDEAKTIVINSEGNIQPNKFFVRENLWVWYVTFQKDKVKLPVEVTVYGAEGQMIYGGKD